MSKLTTRTLGEICDEVDGIIRTGPFGSQLHQSDYKDRGLPVVMPKNIVDGKIDTLEIARIGLEDEKRLHEHKLRIGDIVYARRGDIGRRALIRERENGWLCGTGSLRISLGDRVINPTFLYYYLGNPALISWIQKQAVGATMSNLNTAIVRSIPITYPSLSSQRNIATILSAYDDLIENNARRIQILEEMARAIYRQWFIELKFPGYEGVPLVDSSTELGEIPMGWEILNLNDFGGVITGKTPSKKVDEYWNNSDVQFIRTPDMHDQLYCIKTTDYLSSKGADSQSNKCLPPNSLCVSCIGTVGIVTITAVRAQTNQQINSIVLHDPSDLEFLYFSLVELEGTIKSYASAGATMANLSKGKFMALRVITPSKHLRSRYHELVSPMFEQIKNLQYKNANLRATRDLLLPRLVSGDVGVSELDIAA